MPFGSGHGRHCKTNRCPNERLPFSGIQSSSRRRKSCCSRRRLPGQTFASCDLKGMQSSGSGHGCRTRPGCVMSLSVSASSAQGPAVTNPAAGRAGPVGLVLSCRPPALVALGLKVLAGSRRCCTSATFSLCLLWMRMRQRLASTGTIAKIEVTSVASASTTTKFTKLIPRWDLHL